MYIHITTKDRTFISYECSNIYSEIIKSHKRTTFPFYSKASDFFINFDLLKKTHNKFSYRDSYSEDVENKSDLKQQETNSSQNIIHSNKLKITFNGTPSFGSEIKSEIEMIHPKLDLEKKNDEKFKANLIHSIRGMKLNTDTHKLFPSGKRKCNINIKIVCEIQSINSGGDADTGIITQLKKFKCSSAKSIYRSTFPFVDSDKSPHFFNFFRDDDIGLTSQWRATLIPQSMDNDQDTDDETLVTAVEECIFTLRSGIIQFLEDENSLVNKLQK